jgi:hypothetical protein
LHPTCSASQAVSLSASATLHSVKLSCLRIRARWYSIVRPLRFERQLDPAPGNRPYCYKTSAAASGQCSTRSSRSKGVRATIVDRPLRASPRAAVRPPTHTRVTPSQDHRRLRPVTEFLPALQAPPSSWTSPARVVSPTLVAVSTTPVTACHSRPGPAKTPFHLVSLRWHMRVAAMAVKARKCSGLRS